MSSCHSLEAYTMHSMLLGALQCEAANMTELIITGNDLTITSLAHASRCPGRVTISEEARKKISECREFAETAAARGDEVYGLSTGVGMRKKRKISKQDVIVFNKRMIREHASGQGPSLPADITRATAICLLNNIAKGRTFIRESIASIISQRLSDGPAFQGLPTYGSTGIGDVCPLSHMAMDIYGDTDPAPGEALPMITQSSYVTAHAALAVHDTAVLLNELTVLAAMDVEAFAANPSPYNPVSGTFRPYAGYQKTLSTLHEYLSDSSLHSTPPRHLQAPLSFRCAASVLGAAEDALLFVESQVNIELSAQQQNPLCLPEEDRMVPCAHFDMQPLASALDFMRIALAPCLTAQLERSIKLLQARETGLTDGLEAYGDEGGHGMSEMAFVLQAMVTEAKLLAAPVSFEVGSATQAEGIEDRITMAGLAARRLIDMVHLATRAAAVGVVIACQAIDLRGVDRLGSTLKKVHKSVRTIIPKMGVGESPPMELEPLVKQLGVGFLSSTVVQ